MKLEPVYTSKEVYALSENEFIHQLNFTEILQSEGIKHYQVYYFGDVRFKKGIYYIIFGMHTVHIYKKKK